jgi:hypothetical protein
MLICTLIALTTMAIPTSHLKTSAFSVSSDGKVAVISENEWTGFFEPTTEIIWFQEGVTEITGLLQLTVNESESASGKTLTIILPASVTHIDSDYFFNVAYFESKGYTVNFIAPEGSYIAGFLEENNYVVFQSNPNYASITNITETSAVISIPTDPLSRVFGVHYEFEGRTINDRGSKLEINLPNLLPGTQYSYTVTKYTDLGYEIKREEVKLDFVTKGGSANYTFFINSVSDLKLNVYSVGKYDNWAGVSTTQEFAWQGNLGVAYKSGDNINIIQTNKKGTILKSINFPARYPLLGTVLADENNIYVVYGRENTGEDTFMKTVFVSKYDFDGNFIAEVGTIGDGDYYYNDTFNTKIPFSAGTCTAAINGTTLAVNYAREMYSGHQSNDMFVVDTSTMTEILGSYFYNSHSFDQDIVATKSGGFLAASQGDCYPRAFSTIFTNSKGSVLNRMDTFNFWVEPKTLTNYDMTLLNKTYAYLGGIGETSVGAVLVGASAPELSSAAKTSAKQVFVQVFKPGGNVSDESTYITSGTRTGLAGPDGDIAVTDYGVSWLTTGADANNLIRKIQMVVYKDKIFVFYEKRNTESGIGGTYYQVLNSDGTVFKQHDKLSSEYILNEHEKPAITNEGISWVYGTSADVLKVYTLSVNTDTGYTLSDLAALKKYLHGAKNIVPIDVNGDGVISVVDLSTMKYGLLR